MKKLFSFGLIVFLLSGVSQAQTVLYSETFANGINAAWNNSGSSNGVANSYAKWRYTHSGSHGAYGTPRDFINSPTKTNGFIIFDSDSLDNGGVAGAFGQGPAPAPQIGSLTTSAISVAGTPYCRLNFYQYYRNFQSTTVIGISTDSINWHLDTINTVYAINGQSPNNSQVTIDLSPVILAGGPANKVYLKFIIDANYYFWMIDDITISTLPGNDMQAISLTGQCDNNQGLFYASIPASEADSVWVTSVYSNLGQNTETHCRANFTVLKNGAPIGSVVSSAVVNQLPYSADTSGHVEIQTQGLGQYAVAANITSDSTDALPANNVDTLSFAVTDSVFSINTSTVQSSAYFLLRNNTGQSFRLGTLFQLDHADTVTSVTSAFAGGTGATQAGAVVQATIYPVTVGTSYISYGSPSISSLTRTLAAADISPASGQIVPVTMMMDYSTGSAILPPGTYWVAIGAISTPDSNVLIASTKYQSNGLPVIEQGGTLFFVSATDAAYCNLNFGHPSSLLYTTWTRNPVTSPVTTGQNITFTAHSNASISATYSWTMTGVNSGVIYSGSGRVLTQAFNNADTFNICVTVTDGANSTSFCNTIRVVGSSSGSVTVQNCNGTSISITPQSGTTPGFYPADSLQPCINRGVPVSDTIFFTNYTTLSYMGIPITMNSMTFDSIYLPTGLCWSTNSANNTFAGGQDGVIYISGTTFDSPGQYKLRIIVTANTSLATLPEVDAEKYVGIRYRLRIQCATGSCQAMDNSHADSALYYVPYPSCGSNPPVAVITSSGRDTFCSGSSVILTASSDSGYTYRWSDAARSTTQSITVSTAGVYTVTVYSGGDSAIATQRVGVYLTPPVSISPATSNICQGQSVTLNASGTASGYSWSTGTSSTSSTTVTPSASGTYTVTGTGSNGCTASYTATVTVAALPIVQTIIGSTSITPFQPYTYVVNSLPNINYTWSATNGAIQSGQGTNDVVVDWSGSGPYSITLIQSNSAGCSDTASMLIVNSTCALTASVTAVGPPTLCTGDTLLLIAQAPSGSSYQWIRNGSPISGQNNDTLATTLSGSYQVEVTSGSCSTATGSSTYVFSPQPATPLISSSGSPGSCFSPEVVLTATGGYQAYVWNTGVLTDTLHTTTSGTYTVTVIGAGGCRATSAPFPVNISLLTQYEICLVSVDSATDRNIVIWDKPSLVGVDSFFVYKETNQYNVFQRIGGIGAHDFSTLIDMNSNPQQQADRYTIAVLDTCGNVSIQSMPHKTIHLTINAGLGGVWNLIWNGYEGFTFPSYNIYRGTSTGGLQFLASISSGNTSYTDLTPPGNVTYYQVEAVNPSGCNPTRSANYSSSRSNIIQANNTGIINPYAQGLVNVYPNPSSSTFYFDGMHSGNTIEIFDMLGQLIYTTNADTENVPVVLGTQTKGVYSYRISDHGTSIQQGKLILE